MRKCHHGYSKKSCKECAGEKRIINGEEFIRLSIIGSAMTWYDCIRFEDKKNLSDEELELRKSCSKLAKIYNRRIRSEDHT